MAPAKEEAPRLTTLGLDGKVTIYIAGCECQPFSKMGKNAGKEDDRSKTTKAAVQFIVRRKPEVFILEQVANIKSKVHKRLKDASTSIRCTSCEPKS